MKANTAHDAAAKRRRCPLGTASRCPACSTAWTPTRVAARAAERPPPLSPAAHRREAVLGVGRDARRHEVGPRLVRERRGNGLAVDLDDDGDEAEAAAGQRGVDGPASHGRRIEIDAVGMPAGAPTGGRGAARPTTRSRSNTTPFVIDGRRPSAKPRTFTTTAGAGHASLMPSAGRTAAAAVGREPSSVYRSVAPSVFVIPTTVTSPLVAVDVGGGGSTFTCGISTGAAPASTELFATVRLASQSGTRLWIASTPAHAGSSPRKKALLVIRPLGRTGYPGHITAIDP